MLSLVQITVGEGWHDIMYVIMNGKHSFYWSIYFMLYVLIETLMMTNLLVGVVLDSCEWFDMNEGGQEITMQRRVLFGDQIMELDELEMTYAHKNQGSGFLSSQESYPSCIGDVSPNTAGGRPLLDMMESSITRRSDTPLVGDRGVRRSQDTRWVELQRTFESRRTAQEERSNPSTLTEQSVGRRTSVDRRKAGSSFSPSPSAPARPRPLLPQMTHMFDRTTDANSVRDSARKVSRASTDKTVGVKHSSHI